MKNSTSPNAEIIFKKSTVSVKYTRRFNKVDYFFSYIGGLVGTLIGLILFMGPYTEKAYELSLAKKVMVDNDREEIASSSFNIFYFALTYIKSFLNWMNVNPDWPKVEKYMEASDELTMQIDITYIVKKLIFIDAAMTKLL